MKNSVVVGMLVLCLGMVFFCVAAEDGSAAVALPAVSGETKEYADAVKLFMEAKRSDNKQRNYAPCIENFSKIAESTDNPELRIRSKYFLAFVLFLQRDFPNAILYVKQVLALGKDMYKANPFAVMAGSLSAKLDEGEVSFGDVRSAMSAQKAEKSALLADDLLHYSQTLDTYAAEPVKVKKENLQSTAIVLSLYALVFNLSPDVSIEKVHQAECVSHLHELIAAWRKYCQDHDGKTVPVSVEIGKSGKGWEDTATWVNLMQAYIDDPALKQVQPRSGNILLTTGGALSCPSVIGPDSDSIQSCRPHYGMNHVAVMKEAGGWECLNEMPAPAQTVIFMESKSHYLIGPTWGLPYIDYRHFNGVNCAFADGHVDWLSKVEVEESSKEWGGCAPWQPKAVK